MSLGLSTNRGMTLLEVLIFASISILVILALTETIHVTLKSSRGASVGLDADQAIKGLTTLMGNSEKCTELLKGKAFNPTLLSSPQAYDLNTTVFKNGIPLTPDLTVENIYFEVIDNTTHTPKILSGTTPQRTRWAVKATLNISLRNSAVDVKKTAFGSTSMHRASRIPFWIFAEQTAPLPNWTITNCAAMNARPPVTTSVCKTSLPGTQYNYPIDYSCPKGTYLQEITQTTIKGDHKLYRYCSGKGCAREDLICGAAWCSWEEVYPDAVQYGYTCCALQ